jgi:hypothetical protein
MNEYPLGCLMYFKRFVIGAELEGGQQQQQ